MQGKKLDPGWNTSSIINVTSESRLVTTALRSNSTYIKVYINTIYFIVMYAVPFSVLAVLNYKIGMEIRRAKEKRYTVVLGEKVFVDDRLQSSSGVVC